MNFESSVDFMDTPTVAPDHPLFVYLPGMDGTGRLFENQANKLRDRFDLRCLAIRIDNYSTWHDLARDTVEIIQSELSRKNNQEVYLCGESFGGCLALKTALTAPSLITKLILVNPAYCSRQLPILGWGANITPWLPTWLHRYSAAGLLPFLAKLNRVNNCDRQNLLESMKSLPPQVVSWRLSLLRDFKISKEQLSNLNISSLIIAGAEDGLLPSVEEARKLVRILPDAQMKVLPQSGHACLLETEVNLCQILLEQDFLPTKSNFLVKS